MTQTTGRTREQILDERKETLAAAEMAALCALCARKGLLSPYGGKGWAEGADAATARNLEQVAVDLTEKSEELWREAREAQRGRRESRYSAPTSSDLRHALPWFKNRMILEPRPNGEEESND